MFLDTIECITADYDARIAKIDTKQTMMVEHMLAKETKARKSRQYHAERKKLQEDDTFTKQYHEGVDDLKALKDTNKISFADFGKFMFICRYIEWDTGMICRPNTSIPMTIPEIAKNIGDHKQHLYKTFDKLMELSVVIKRNINGGDVYFVNPKYSFNGYSRVKANTVIFNNCTFGDNASIVTNL